MQTRRATVSFKTVGCRLNQAETATIRASFEEAGYSTVPFGELCDICVIHGCVVTSKAEEDSTRLVRSIKRRYPKAFMVLAGCAAELIMKGSNVSDGRANPAKRGASPQVYHASSVGEPGLIKRLGRDASPYLSKTSIHEEADYLAGQADKFNLPALFAPGGLRTETPPSNVPPRFSTKRAIVKIQDGCDFCCSYCIVPSVRGSSQSRPSAEISAEITKLTLCGFPEIVLTGANIGCYDEGGLKLAQLLEKVEVIPGLKRFRISSLEIANAEQGRDASPRHPICGRLGPRLRQGLRRGEEPSLPRFKTSIFREVVDFLATSKKMCRCLHLPLQSGSDKILKAMGRPYSANEYCGLVEYARSKLGLFGLGTDIIVGFPGETNDDFMETERLIKQLPFTKLHVFSYSPRPGTSAAAMDKAVSKKEKDMRVARLIELGLEKRKAFAQAFIGKYLCFVVEKVRAGWAEGWTGEYLWARVRSNDLKPKQIVSFVCERVEHDILLGKL